MAEVLDTLLRARLDELAARDLRRVRRVVDGAHGVDITVDGRSCVNFCSNDYLGLAADPRLAEAARTALARLGTGSGASALISGHNREHRLLEEELAAFLGVERCLLFSSGWAANLGTLRALLGREDVLVADELNHASLIDGGRLSGARYVRAAHGDLAAYAAAVAGNRESGIGNRLTAIVTDAVFSMDGDLAPLPGLATLCREHGAMLMVDDAHGFGVLGATGRGTVEHFGDAIPDSRFPIPDIHVATLGKALGASGAFVAGSETLIDYLVQRARSWVFSTAPPPALAAAARAALRIVQTEPERRQRLFDNIRYFRDGVRQRGLAAGLPDSRFPIPDSRQVPTPIQPLLIGDAGATMAVSQGLHARGCWVAGIRPPTVPAGTSRLRITLSAAHGRAHIDRLLDALAEVLPQEQGAMEPLRAQG